MPKGMVLMPKHIHISQKGIAMWCADVLSAVWYNLCACTQVGRNYATAVRRAPLVIWNQSDTLSERLANFIVTASDRKWPVTHNQLSGPEFRKCGQYHGIPPAGATVKLECNPSGVLSRYVYIHTANEDNWSFTICEAEVAGCELTWSLDCCHGYSKAIIISVDIHIKDIDLSVQKFWVVFTSQLDFCRPCVDGLCEGTENRLRRLLVFISEVATSNWSTWICDCGCKLNQLITVLNLFMLK